jgi:hypothetical protein
VDSEVDLRLELIYRESVRKLDQQAAVVESVRSRIGLLLGAGAIADSFLAPAALEEHGWEWPAWLGTGFLILVAGLGVTILLPYNWAFSHKVEDLLRVYVEGPKPRSINGMYKWLALKNDKIFEDNRDTLNWFLSCYQVATFALLASIGCWLGLLAS